MKVYISGPMTGYEAFNSDAFNVAEKQLASLGHEVLNPARHPVCDTWADYLRLDLIDVVTADALAVLPGWEASRGARLEVHVAHALGMTVLPIDRWSAAT